MWLLAALLLVVTGGCADSSGSESVAPAVDSGPAVTTDAGPSLSLGVSDSDAPHTDVPDGAEVDVFHGPQGGYHVLLSIDARHVGLTGDESAVPLRWSIRAGDTPLASGRTYLPLENIRPGEVTHTGMRLVFNTSIMPQAWMREPLFLDVTLLTEANAELARAQRHWLGTCCIDLVSPDAGTR